MQCSSVFKYHNHATYCGIGTICSGPFLLSFPRQSTTWSLTHQINSHFFFHPKKNHRFSQPTLVFYCVCSPLQTRSFLAENKKKSADLLRTTKRRVHLDHISIPSPPARVKYKFWTESIQSTYWLTKSRTDEQQPSLSTHHITPSPIIHLHRLQRGVNCKVRSGLAAGCGRLHGSSPKHSKVLFLTQRIFYSQPRALLYYSVGSTSRRGLNQSVPNTPTYLVHRLNHLPWPCLNRPLVQTRRLGDYHK